MQHLNLVLKKIFPPGMLRRVRQITQWPPVGRVEMGDLRRGRPISQRWGYDPSQPIDHYYIGKFLASYAADVRGAILEIGDASYTKKYGGDRWTSIDVLHYASGNAAASIVGDLVDAPQILDGKFDCVICTQTFQFVSDPKAAMATLHRILRPGGVLLFTAPCLSQLNLDPKIPGFDRWRFTSTAIRELAESCAIEGDRIEVASFGNVLAATAFLQGIASGEMRFEELDNLDRMFEMVVSLRLRKSDSISPPKKPTPAIAGTGGCRTLPYS